MFDKKPLIGFIGQGWIGKNYADNFEERGYDIIRYALEEPYAQNKEHIKKCDIVFIAVPTPTTPNGFDVSILQSVFSLIGKEKIAVIKSTLLPGTTKKIQAKNPDIFIVHSPEFLRESSAYYDAANPKRNIIGLPQDSEIFREKAREVLAVLPFAPYQLVCPSREAELIKYAGNCFLYQKVVFANILYDLTQKLDCRWEVIRDGMAADPRIGKSHLDPVHKSGRGAGGHCFIKDFEAFLRLYEELTDDPEGVEALKAIREKNIQLLRDSQKDLDLLKGIYGEKKV